VLGELCFKCNEKHGPDHSHSCIKGVQKGAQASLLLPATKCVLDNLYWHTQTPCSVVGESRKLGCSPFPPELSCSSEWTRSAAQITGSRFQGQNAKIAYEAQGVEASCAAELPNLFE
jgi:hypothetical protein